MHRLGASVGTLRIVKSYLTNRWAVLELEGIKYKRMLERGSSQGSQLGPTLLKVAMIPVYEAIRESRTIQVITYAHDILLMTGVARPHTAFRRIEKELDILKAWTADFKLEFSASKTQLLSLKGRLKPGYTIGFGTEGNAPRVTSTATEKYLGVLLDPRRSFWDHVVSVSQKSTPMYNRLRVLYSAKLGHRTSSRQDNI